MHIICKSFRNLSCTSSESSRWAHGLLEDRGAILDESGKQLTSVSQPSLKWPTFEEIQQTNRSQDLFDWFHLSEWSPANNKRQTTAANCGGFLWSKLSVAPPMMKPYVQCAVQVGCFTNHNPFEEQQSAADNCCRLILRWTVGLLDTNGMLPNNRFEAVPLFPGNFPLLGIALKDVWQFNVSTQ